MAFTHTLSIFSIAVMVAVISVTNVTADTIDAVCGKTPNPSLCSQTLRADPRSKNGDLKSIGLVAIDVATNQAKSSQNLVQSILKSATDPKLKEIYSSCLENYSDSVDDLGKCSDLLRSRDFAGLNARASAALDNPVTCDDSFSGGSAEPPQLKDGSKKLQEFCSIILVVSNLSKGA